uniref:PH domain-containing protein n=1 Tax=Syphacia muris TaxID=451379 RepID=A0A0N5AXN0_9BILA
MNNLSHDVPPSASTKNGSEEESPEDRKITLKKQKREYKDEKKRVIAEMAAALRDPTVVIMADWLKVRGTLRKWKRYYCVLVPGLFVIYRSDKVEKHGQWIGSILLNMCNLIERPSKKNGFCFKLFNPSDRYIWASRGPHGEIFGALTVHRLPSSNLICRAASEQAGGCWMDALNMALRCNGLIMKTMRRLSSDAPQREDVAQVKEDDNDAGESEVVQYEQVISEIEAEKHFDGLDDDNDNGHSDVNIDDVEYEQSSYIASEVDMQCSRGDTVQTEDLADENKSLIWSLLKQVRPGMDLSRVTLPTFILEPRSFLEKLADFYYHADVLAKYIYFRAVVEQNSYDRLLKVVTFYLSGFYKKPKGLKKPYNPILGETFRCKWEHPDGSVTFYIAEQVSHHPPMSSLYITNRKAGFNICGTILAKSKYYGNSLSAMMLGQLRITLLDFDETYTVTLPYANCKGIMIGTLCMEYGGEVKIECNKHSLTCVLDFKLKPFLGGSLNVVKGEIKNGKETLATIGGHWDSEITLTENGKETILWSPTPNVIKQRLPRYEIPLENQGEWESKKLWLKVSNAIARGDQVAATVEKTILEDAQRVRAKQRDRVYEPRLFKYYAVSKTYEYIYADFKPWDKENDIMQIEHNYIVRTITRNGFSRKISSSASLRREQSEASDISDSMLLFLIYFYDYF